MQIFIKTLTGRKTQFDFENDNTVPFIFVKKHCAYQNVQSRDLPPRIERSCLSCRQLFTPLMVWLGVQLAV